MSDDKKEPSEVFVAEFEKRIGRKLKDRETGVLGQLAMALIKDAAQGWILFHGYVKEISAGELMPETYQEFREEILKGLGEVEA